MQSIVPSAILSTGLQSFSGGLDLSQIRTRGFTFEEHYGPGYSRCLYAHFNDSDSSDEDADDEEGNHQVSGTHAAKAGVRISNRALDRFRLGSRCRTVLVIQLPIFRMYVFTDCCLNPCGTPRVPIETITSPIGINLGQVQDVTIRSKTDHQFCPEAGYPLNNDETQDAGITFRSEIGLGDRFAGQQKLGGEVKGQVQTSTRRGEGVR